MDERFVVASGTYGDEMSWVVWARRDQPRHGYLLSMIRISDASGRIVHAAGSSGPPLYPGHVLNVTTSGSEEGPRAVLARASTEVTRVELLAQDGISRDVPLYDCPEIPEVRFAMVLVPRNLALASVAAFAAEGELERVDLRLQQGQWEMRYRHTATG